MKNLALILHKLRFFIALLLDASIAIIAAYMALHTNRKPKLNGLNNKLPIRSLSRAAERQLVGGVFQAPPRITKVCTPAISDRLGLLFEESSY